VAVGDPHKLLDRRLDQVSAVAVDQRVDSARFGGGRVDGLQGVAGAKDAVGRQQPQG
jgi:hypothetical protein